MRSYPQPGERWQHERGWTVTIIRLIEASPSVALVKPVPSQPESQDDSPARKSQTLGRYGSACTLKDRHAQ